jgi:signal transduction histidine kinase
VPFVTVTGLSFTLVLALLLFLQIQFREHQSSVLAALRRANEKLTARARERARLSRDLHDGSIQNLYALGLNLQRVQPLMLTAPARAQEELAAGLHLLNQTVAELRHFIEASEEGADLGATEPRTVATVIHSFAEQLRQTARCELRVEVDPRAAKLEPSSAVQLLNLVREAASNALRHSGTKDLLIRLIPVEESAAGLHDESDDAVLWRLTVEDHGCGFDLPKVRGRGHGLGNLEVRARELGGNLSLRSAPGAGTTVTVEFRA